MRSTSLQLQFVHKAYLDKSLYAFIFIFNSLDGRFLMKSYPTTVVSDMYLKFQPKCPSPRPKQWNCFMQKEQCESQFEYNLWLILSHKANLDIYVIIPFNFLYFACCHFPLFISVVLNSCLRGWLDLLNSGKTSRT